MNAPCLLLRAAVTGLSVVVALSASSCSSDAAPELSSVSEDSTSSEVRSAVSSYLQKRFFHTQGGNTYTSFVPIPEGQGDFQNNWRKQVRNHPHESLVTLSLAMLGRCAEAESILLTFFQQQSANGGYRYDTRYDRGAWDDQGYAAAPLLAFETAEVYRICKNQGFLQTAYSSLARNKAWWDDRSGRRFPQEQGRQCNGLWHWNDPIESIRDSLPEAGFPLVPTWALSEGIANQCAADLNFYLVATYRAMAKLEAQVGAADGFAAIAENLSATLREQLWDEGTQFFYGVDRRTGQKVWVKDIGGWMALFAGVATKEQANAMVSAHLKSGGFHSSFGLPSLDKTHPSFGSNLHWSGGFWPGLTLLVVKGLADYGYVSEAQRIARPFCQAVTTGVRQGIPLPEWYDSEKGNLRDLFCELNNENSPDNAKVNCDYITSALALPMASYAGL